MREEIEKSGRSTLLMLAELTDDDAVMDFVATVHEEFQGVLPALEPLDV